jgi:hypothetical protein
MFYVLLNAPVVEIRRKGLVVDSAERSHSIMLGDRIGVQTFAKSAKR